MSIAELLAPETRLEATAQQIAQAPRASLARLLLLMLLAFFVSCFRWGRGAQRLLGVPEGETAEFIAIALIAASIALQIAGALLADLL